MVALWGWDDSCLKVQKTCTLEQATIDGSHYNVKAWATALHPSGDIFVAAGEGLSVALFSAKTESFGQGIGRFSTTDSEETGFALKAVFVCPQTNAEL